MMSSPAGETVPTWLSGRRIRWRAEQIPATPAMHSRHHIEPRHDVGDRCLQGFGEPAFNVRHVCSPLDASYPDPSAVRRRLAGGAGQVRVMPGF
jgi:hypothetical protein